MNIQLKQAAEDGIKDTDGSVLNIKSKMDPWVLQSGFPKVTVVTNKDGTATISQTVHDRYGTSGTDKRL